MDRDYYSDSMMMVKPSRKASNAGGGKSAYEIWLDEGHTGSEADFLKSLQGEGFDPSACTLSLHTDGLLYMFYHGQPMGNGIALPSGSSGDVVGNVDSENNIIVTGKLTDGTYTVKYEMEDGTTVDIGDLVLDSNTYYSVTKNLTNCTVSNSATQVVGGGSYSATVTANSGYTLDSVSVTMGGSAVSVSGGVINIASVTGDIVITAVASEATVAPGYTNLADPTSSDWLNDYRLSVSSGNPQACAGRMVTNFIPATKGDILRSKGFSLTTETNSQAAKIVCYDASKTKISGTFGATGKGNSYYGDVVTFDGDIETVTILLTNEGGDIATSDTAYIRIEGVLMEGYTAEDVIITINEEIV